MLETYGFVLDESFELGLPCSTSDIGGQGSDTADAVGRSPVFVAKRFGRGRELETSKKEGVTGGGQSA